MTPQIDGATGLPHGGRDLPSVRVDAYNAELTDPSGEGFLGDRASNRAFMDILEDWRERVARVIEAVPPGQVIGYADLAHVAGVQSSYCRAFPRLLSRLGPAYAARAVPARAEAHLPRWDGADYHAQAEV